MFKEVTKIDAVGRRDAHTGNGQGRPSGGWLGHRHLGETSRHGQRDLRQGTQKPGQDFFPLTVHYQEKYYAAGKVPGGFFKREARPTEKETLTARLIDRPIRPLFVPGFKNEVLVMCTVLSTIWSMTPTWWR